MNHIAQKSQLLENKKVASCHHCGEPCSDFPFLLEDKFFCCEGCKLVYSILQENDLCTYYDLNRQAGISQKNKRQQQYAFLEETDTIERLIDFKNGDQIKVRFFLPQIHCSSCLWLLEHLHRLNEGIQQSRVDFIKKEVSIIFSVSVITLRDLVELLALIGYPPIIQFDDLDKPKKATTDKTLYYKLGLAGFVFGNVMLLSFPEYLGLERAPNHPLTLFFGYLNIVLILPVVLYSGLDYFRSAWQGLQQRHLNIDVPISLGILALFSRSVYEILSQTGAGYLDSLAGLIFFLLIGKWFQQKTYNQISFDRDYKSYFPIACMLLKEGKEQSVTLDKLKIGDHILIRHGELIPTDAILMSADAYIDYSFVSGESDLIKKNKGEQLYAGGRQMGGSIEMRVSKKVANSYLTQLWNEAAFDKNKEKGQVSILGNRVASIFTRVILGIAFLTLFYWFPIDSSRAINAFTAVLIIACPCAVALSIPFVFGNIIQLLGKKGIYLKNTQVVESLTRITHIVFDKTGTITSTAKSKLAYQGQSLSTQEQQWIRSLVHHSAHPLSRQINQHFQSIPLLSVTDFQEIKGAGINGSVNGHFIKIGSAEYIHDAIVKKSGTYAGVHLAIDGLVKGTFTIKANYRKGLARVINTLSQWAGLSLLSGDNDQEKSRVLPLFKQERHIHFNQKPIDKLRFIEDLQQVRQEVVAMIGDGLNDAGALSQADVGIVLSEETANFTPACDVIMEAAHFDQIPKLFSLARRSIQLVYVAYAIALVYNSIGLYFAVQGSLSPVIAAILMPLSSVSIVLFGVGASTALAYRYGFIEWSDKNHEPL